MQSFIRPKRLLQGGTIGVVAPSGIVEQGDLHRGVLYLEKLGFKVVLGQHLESAHRYFAGSDSDRAADFLGMMQNPTVDAVLCARGGSGAARIIPYLDQAKSIPPKAVVGMSDITTLLLYLSEKHHLITFHGPMVAPQFGKESHLFGERAITTQAAEQLFLILSGEQVTMSASEMTVLNSGAADGILTGGCLSLICTTIGTVYEIDTNDRILFIEDVNEAPYRIDRMLYYLKTLNKFNHIRGLIVGQMPGCQPNVLPEMIFEMMQGFDFPILFGFPSGHGEPIFTLPFGASVRLDTTDAPSLAMLTPAVSVE